jgi:hypothetical protein
MEIWLFFQSLLPVCFFFLTPFHFSMAALAAALAIFSAKSNSRPEDWLMVLMLGLWVLVWGLKGVIAMTKWY